MKVFTFLLWLSFLVTMTAAFSTSFYVNMASVQNGKVRHIRDQYRKMRGNKHGAARRAQTIGRKMTPNFLKLLNLKMRQMSN